MRRERRRPPKARCIITYIMRRTQIYLDDDQDRRLERRARATGTSRSALIREAIDRFLRRERDPSMLEDALNETVGALKGITTPSRDEWDRDYG
jgi:predicted DNA-binding protein